MGPQLRIGDVAALLGVSTKTIRYYHSVGLLPEPTRAANGYRLYGVPDLVHVQRIRRLQTLGLSLKQIRTLLGAPVAVHQLHPVLRALLGEVDAQIAALHERRARIVAALGADAAVVAGPSPTFAGIEAQLRPYLTDEHAALLEGEQQFWALFDAAQPPDEFQAAGNTIAAQLAAHPEEVQALVHWGERLSALSDTPPDDPAIELLAHEFVHSPTFHFLNTAFGAETQPPPNAGTSALWSALVVDALTPAQQHFLELVQRFASIRGAA